MLHWRQDAEAANAVVAAIDATALAVYLALKTPEEGPGSAKRKKEFDEQARLRCPATRCLSVLRLVTMPATIQPRPSPGSSMGLQRDHLHLCPSTRDTCSQALSA